MPKESELALPESIKKEEQELRAVTSALQENESKQIEVAMVCARRFPRDASQALDLILKDCTRAGLAEVAEYQYKRGSEDVTGPTIRLAEAIAQRWGNIRSGWRVIDQYEAKDGVGVSVVEAFAWDLESNYYVPRVFNVRHWRDTRGGGYKIEGERDVYELVANMASRRVRACLLSVIPGDVVETALDQCRATAASKADVTEESVAEMVKKFAEINVSKSQIESYFQRPVNTISPAQYLKFRRIYRSIRDGITEPGEWFKEEQTGDGEIERPNTAKAKAEDKPKADKPKESPEEQTAEDGQLPI